MEKTATKMRSALLHLINHKPYQDISVQNIYAQAGLSRATFYRYFANKDDLLAHCLEHFSEELKEIIPFPTTVLPQKTSQVMLDNLTNLFVQIDEKRDFYKVVFTNPTVSIKTYEYFRRLIKGFVILTASHSGIVQDLPLPLEIVAHMVVGGQLELIRWWLSTDAPYPPAVLAEISLRMFEKGIFGLMGWPGTSADISNQPFTWPQ